ncbi:uncharacterized protein LOC131293814 [Anopheles ziemanni]|uniref:uncharacterized protein LOC131293814 n=1 Tax=Anopheles ziemanni TaxID=345580 RepID=UPI00265D9047|nr:uncharacterized protein LOC131293814 [Anopheles ziemanni]
MIVWDEASMSSRYALEAVNRTLQDIVGVHRPVGGKVVLLCGDFRQNLPIVPRGTDVQVVQHCIKRIPLWHLFCVLRLRVNMRLQTAPNAQDANDLQEFLPIFCSALISGVTILQHNITWIALLGAEKNASDFNHGRLVVAALVKPRQSCVYPQHQILRSAYPLESMVKLGERRELNIPAPEILQPPYKMEVAYYLLGDQAFAMKEYCLRPYGGMHAADSIERYFKHRHSRARRVVENAFSIAVKLWRVLSKPIELEPHVAEKVVMATIHLHNFRRRHLLYNYTSAIHLPPTRSTESSSAAHNENSGEELPSSMLSLPAPLRPTRTLQNMRSHLAQHFKANDPLPFSLPHPHRQ